MKFLIYLLAGVLAALSLSGTALAENGNVTTVEHYRSAYNDYFYGPIACSGAHQTGKNFGQWGQDSFTCTSTTGNPLPGVSPDQSIDLATTNGWYSDYWYFIASPGFRLYATSLTGQVSDDGMSFSAVASY